MNNKFKNVLALGGFIIFAIVASFFISNEDVELMQETATSNDEEIKIDDKIFVYILGAVHEPGIVEISSNSRLYEVINLSGGATNDADLSKINLASIVKDEQKIIVPYKENSDSGDAKIYDFNYENFDDEQLININTATQEMLEKLTGIGSSTAKKIIKYREENGYFTSIEDIKNVSGIGENKYDVIKDEITI